MPRMRAGCRKVSAPSSSTSPVQRPADRAGVEHRHAVWWVVLTVAVGALAAGLLGLLLDDVYVGDAATAAMFRGYDAVTLVVVVPALLVAWGKARGGSERARLVVASLLLYLAYTYAYYLFGTGFNDLLLLHAIVFSWLACRPDPVSGLPRHRRGGGRLLGPNAGPGGSYCARGAGRRAGGHVVGGMRGLPGHGIVADG